MRTLRCHLRGYRPQRIELEMAETASYGACNWPATLHGAKSLGRQRRGVAMKQCRWLLLVTVASGVEVVRMNPGQAIPQSFVNALGKETAVLPTDNHS